MRICGVIRVMYVLPWRMARSLFLRMRENRRTNMITNLIINAPITNGPLYNIYIYIYIYIYLDKSTLGLAVDVYNLAVDVY